MVEFIVRTFSWNISSSFCNRTSPFLSYVQFEFEQDESEEEYSSEDASDEEYEEELDSDESSGKDWSDLEREAAEDDADLSEGEGAGRHRSSKPSKHKHRFVCNWYSFFRGEGGYKIFLITQKETLKAKITNLSPDQGWLRFWVGGKNCLATDLLRKTFLSLFDGSWVSASIGCCRRTLNVSWIPLLFSGNFVSSFSCFEAQILNHYSIIQVARKEIVFQP